jgi:hypothetical protein
MKIPAYQVIHLPEDMVLDGNINKTAWDTASIVELVRTRDGGKPRQKTRVKFGWTSTHLWAAFHCEDSHIVASLTEHDHPRLWTENVVEVFIDPLGLEKIYYELQVNCRNTGFDGIVHNASGRVGIGPDQGIQCLTAWNPKSFCQMVSGRGIFNGTAASDEYWDVELCIGFNDLYLAPNKPPRPGDRWRVNIFRVDSGPWGQEYYAWSPTIVPKFHISELFGVMEFTEERLPAKNHSTGILDRQNKRRKNKVKIKIK